MGWKFHDNQGRLLIRGEQGSTGPAGPSGSNTIIVGEQDGSPRVLDVVEIKFSGSTVTDEGAGIVLVVATASGSVHDHPYVTVTSGGLETVHTVAASGAAETLNLASGNVHDVTLTANCTLTLTGATAGVACAITILLRQDGTGSRLVTWPGSVTWIGGAAPTLQTDPGDFDVAVLFTLDGGTNWIGSAASTPGVLDHGALTGLADDDHSAYTTVIGGGGDTRQVHGNTGATETVDLANGNAHDLTLDAATVTLTLAATAAGVQCELYLYLHQDASGSRLVSWPGSVQWPTAAPILATTALDMDLVRLVTLDGGFNWFGYHFGNYTPVAVGAGGTFPILALSTNL